MTVMIMPYVKYDGIPTFRDSEVKGFYRLMERDGTAQAVFCNGIVSSEDDFFDYINNKNTVLYVALDSEGHVPLGIGWMNNFENKTARAHFCIFAEGWGNSTEVGRQLVRTASEFGGIDMLIGMIPLSNDRAIKFSQRCGAQLAGILPKGSCLQDGTSVPTAILYYLRSRDNE